MQVMYGANALSSFRVSKLLADVQTQLPQVTHIASQFIHFIDSEIAIDAAQAEQLQSLLGVSGGVAITGGQQLSVVQRIVVPRAGTISPWSSKATDILHNCGLPNISRVERGTVFDVTSKMALSKTDLQTLDGLLHDRMTQSILSTVNSASLLFKQAEPQAVAAVDILGKGRKELVNANKAMGLALADDEIDYVLVC